MNNQCCNSVCTTWQSHRFFCRMHCFIHHWLFIVGILTVSLLLTSHSYSVMLSLEEQKDVWGGDQLVDTQNNGISNIPTAWSGNVTAVIYDDYAIKDHPGYVLLLIAGDGKPVTGTIKLCDESDQYVTSTGLIWDGQAFTALYPGKGFLTLKRVLPDGTVLSTVETSIAVNLAYKFQAIFEDGKVILINAVTPEDKRIYNLSPDGKTISEPVSLRLTGDVVKILSTPAGWAILTKISVSPVRYILNFVDRQGNDLCNPIQFLDAAITPASTINWNGSILMMTAAFKNSDGSIVLKTFTYNARGEQLNEPVVYAVIPYESYYGKINFASELIWTGTYYMVVWEQGVPNQFLMEDTLIAALDSNGNPVSNVLQINSKPLNQANHTSYYIDSNQCIVITIEKGNHNPKVVYSKIKTDLQAGAVLPTTTPTPNLLLQTPTPTPTPFSLPADMQIMTVSTFISGRDILHIKGNAVWFEHVELDVPGKWNTILFPTTINGQEWYPEWNPEAKVSDKYNSLNPPLPQTDGFYYAVNIKQARGKIIIVQEPVASNQYEAILLFDNYLVFDNSNGDTGWFNAEFRWAKSPISPPIQLPNSPSMYWKGAVAKESIYGAFLIIIQDKKAEFKSDNWLKVYTSSMIFTEALPRKNVNISPSVLKGNVTVDVLQQPRAENNYQAILAVRLSDRRENPGELQIVLTWNDILPDPAPTPWPTLSPNAPTPTPASAPKVLWIVLQGMMTAVHEQYKMDLDQFRDIFTAVGSKSYVVIAGSAVIDFKLLNGYAAVIFGNVWKTPPVTGPEQDAIVQYVRSGGSILIMGGQQSSVVPEPPSIYASSIGKLFGIEFSPTAYIDQITDFEQHFLLNHVESLSGSGSSRLLITPPAQVLGRAGTAGKTPVEKAFPLLAIANPDFGRVVAYASADAFYSRIDESNKYIEGYSNMQFATNLASWLLHKENAEIPTMTPFQTATNTYTPTSTPTVDPDATAAPTPHPLNLLAIYPTTLTVGDTDPNHARPWEFTVDDIYSLSKFSYSFNKNDSLKIDTGPADVGIGHSKDGAVWAIVIPRNNGAVTSSLLQQTERIKHIWMRFHPAVITDLFPDGAVFPVGDKSLYPTMQRIADHKFRNSWHAGQNATIPPPDTFNFDMDTDENRRFFYIEKDNLIYYANFEGMAVPDPVPVSEDNGAMFDTVWNEFDQNYAMFILRPDVNWDELKTMYRPKALEAKDQFAFAAVIAEMLTPLRDLHVWYMVSSSYVSIYGEPVSANANLNAYTTIIGTLEDAGKDVQYGKTSDNYGFIAIYKWSDQNTPSAVDNALEQLKDTKGLIVDVRYNGGGSEPLAQQVAGRFADKPYIYAYHRYRNGPKHTDLGGYNARSVSPQGAWRYDKPVICLIGKKCMSSNESFAAMMGECPNVTLMGDRTRGSSGNPKVVDLPMDMQFSVPRWIDYLPDKTPLDKHGVYPDVWFEPKAGAFEGNRDDLLQAALDRLRENGTSIFNYMMYEFSAFFN